MTNSNIEALQAAGNDIGIPLEAGLAKLLLGVAADIAAAKPAERPLVLGVSGAQGSGKSTISRLLEVALDVAHGLGAVAMSIDDFYLPKAERERLAATVHPLCRTRGVPGTHDPALARRTIAALLAAGPQTRTPLPQFSKLEDDRVPESRWPVFQGRPDVVILEGWCVGARYRDPASWSGPINALEAEKDPQGIWWRWSNGHLKGDYQALWAMFDLLLFIRVPDFETVVESRIRQEDTLARQNPELAKGRMSRAEIVTFTAHYERYTNQLREDLPPVADILLDRERGYTYHRLK